MNKSEKSLVSRAVEIIKQGRVVALTGAGVSTESGIPDFRGQGGLWSRYHPMEYGTLGAFRQEPQKIWEMLKELYGFLEARPNQGHLGLARLEEMGLLNGIITQNIDGLHQKAGSKIVVEFHGSPITLSCPRCGAGYLFEKIKDHLPPQCGCGEILKPDIVFFDEPIPPLALKEAEQLLAGARTLLVAGTSCQVMPAAYFPAMFHGRGGRVIELNLEPTLHDLAHIALKGGFSEVMAAIVESC